MRRARSWFLLVAVGLLLVGCSTPGTGTAGDAANATAQVVPPDQVQALAAPGVALTRPADGRLRGYGFAAVVTGVASAHQAGGPAPFVTVVSSPGHHLVVFTATFATYPVPDPVGTGTTPPLSADVSLAGGHLGFDPSILTTKGHATYAVSVPNGSRTVDLELTSAGLTQSFSLTALHRVGPQPVALYRDPARPTVSTTIDQAQSMPVNVPADGFTGVQTLTIKTATLTDFQPGNPSVQPADPNQAYLAVNGSDGSDPDPPPGYPSGSHFVGSFSAIPASGLTLELPGGQTATGTHVGSTTNGLLDGTYYFTVPADFTSATLSVAPGSQAGVEYPVFTGSPATVDFPQPAAFAIDLPPVPAAPVTAATTPPTGGPVVVTQQGHPSSQIWRWLGAGIGLVAAVLLSLAWRRRKRGRNRRPRHPGLPPFRPLRPIPTAPAVLALPGGSPVDADDAPVREDRSGDAFDKPTESATNGSDNPATNVSEFALQRAGALPADRQSGPTAAGAVEVLVLGPVEVTGWRSRPRRKVVTALLCYFCLHPGRPVSGERLLAALWPLDSDRPEASRASLHTYASELRRSLPEGCLPDAGTTGGYLLAGQVVSDWVTFASLVAEAVDAEPDSAAVLLARALSLVRGVPFEGATSELFEWATTEHHVAAMEVAIADCAHRLVTLRLASGDLSAAEEAALQGLVGVPDVALLHADLIRVASMTADPARLRRAWRGARRTLGEDGVARLVAELETSAPVHQPTS